MSNHPTPRMGNRPDDPAFSLLRDSFQTVPRVHNPNCYICNDMEFARMGLPLCSPCCKCTAEGNMGHIAADDGECDICAHERCDGCDKVPAQERICTCNTPCCEVDVGIGVITCESKHCPTHGEGDGSESGTAISAA